MNKLFFSIIICASSLSIYCSEITPPTFAEPIILFKQRNLATKGQECCPDIPVEATVAAWLATPQAFGYLQAAAERQQKKIGYEQHRIETYSGFILKPQVIVLTRSSKATLQETVQGLRSVGLAHNFIVNTNGDIHPITCEGETVQEALRHRPFSLGISGFELDGHCTQRDMNSAAISISVVGNTTDPITPEQADGLIKLVTYLKTDFNITADKIQDYGRIAYPYGRRNPSPGIMDCLAKHNLAIRPHPEQVAKTNPLFKKDTARNLWTSLALRKLGFINVPITRKETDPEFKKALQAFQKDVACTNQSGDITDETIAKLNSMLLQYETANPALKDIEPPTLPLS